MFGCWGSYDWLVMNSSNELERSLFGVHIDVVDGGWLGCLARLADIMGHRIAAQESRNHAAVGRKERNTCALSSTNLIDSIFI